MNPHGNSGKGFIMKIWFGIAALVSGVVLAAPATARTVPDFTSDRGMQKTCDTFGKLPAKNVRGSAEKIAFVICRDIGLVQRVASFAHRRFERNGMPSQPLETTVNEVMGLLDEMARELKTTRQVLETIHIDKAALRLAPARWQIDLNGDGRIELWERHFFAPPSRNAQATPNFSLSDDAAYYAGNTSDAFISVDQADVQWLLAYHNFLEGMLDNVLSYRIDFKAKTTEDMITLTDRERAAKTSPARIRAGWAASRATLLELKRETDNHEEWIPNPWQTNSSFPLKLGASTFAAWEAVLDEVDALLAGKTLLAMPGASSSAICQPGAGLDLGHLMMNPVPRPLAAGSLRASCRPINRAHPVSRLPAMGEEARAAFRAAGGDWAMARYLYWIN